MEVGLPRFLEFVVALVTILLLDYAWFTATYTLFNLYRFRNIKVQYGLLAWIALALAISTSRATAAVEDLAFGGMVGFVSYMVFNGTELAINETYRNTWHVPVVDVLWGTTACATASLATRHLVAHVS